MDINRGNPFLLSGLAEGSYTLDATATDLAGNVSTTTTSSFDLKRYTLTGSISGTGSTLFGNATGDVAGVTNQDWGGSTISSSGSYSGTPSTSWQTQSGGQSKDSAGSPNGYWLDIASGSYTGNSMNGTSNLSLITQTTLGTGTGTITGSHDTTNFNLTSTSTSFTETPLKFVSNVDAFRYYLQNTGALTAVETKGAGTNPYSVTVDPTGKFAYVANGNSNNVWVYTIDTSTGALTAVGTPIAAGTYPTSVAVDPTGKFAYVTNRNSNDVWVYTINQSTGALTAVETKGAGTYPTSVAVDPTGKFVYVANLNSNNVSVYTINTSTGALTAGTPIAAGTNPFSVAVDPTGKFAYVANLSSNNVSVYTINTSTGALTAGTPVATGSSPFSVAVDPTGRFAYVANYGSNTVSMYSINQSSGVLTLVGTPIAAGTTPQSVAVDPTGKFAYVANYGSNTVSVYTINQTTGALTAVGTAVATGSNPYSVTVDPTGKFVYVANGDSNTVSVYTIDALTRVADGSLTAYTGGTTSLWNGGTTPVTMIGSYDPISPSAFVWGQTVNSYNYLTGQNVTYDTPSNAYVGYLTGYKADDDTMKAKWASVYVKDDGSAGIHLGTLDGTAYPGIKMFKMDGTVNVPVEIVSSGGMGIITPVNLYSTYTDFSSNYNGTPVMNNITGIPYTGGSFGMYGSITPDYYKQESVGITGQDWGVWRSVNSGTYNNPMSSSAWTLSADYKYFSWEKVIGSEATGTLWTGNKLEGTTVGYGANINTGKTWISTGETIGTYNPVAATYQAVSVGPWIETTKFLAMAADMTTGGGNDKLQRLNIPCVEVGSVSLAGSGSWIPMPGYTGTMNVTMDNVKFFSNNAGAPARIWAAGQGQMGSWSEPMYNSSPPAGITANLISLTGLNALFTVKTFDTTTGNPTSGKWLATVTNGSGFVNSYSTTFRGAAAGTINTGLKTFSGTAAGVAKAAGGLP